MGLAKFVIGKTYTTCGTLDGGGRLLTTEMGMAKRPNQTDISRTLREFVLLQGGAPKIAKLVYNSHNYGL